MMKTNGDRAPEEIQADIERTRADLNQTLSAIEHRLTPSQLFDLGVDYMHQSHVKEYVTNLGERARHEPVPLALVGIGLAWLMMTSGRSSAHVDVEVHRYGPSTSDRIAGGMHSTAEGVRNTAHSTAEGMRDTAHKTAEGVRSGMASARDTARDTMNSVRDTVSSMRDTASRTTQRISDTAHRVGQSAHSARERASQMSASARIQADRMRSRYTRVVNEQPLALGVLGLAVGAILAATAPRTRREDYLMGDASDRLKHDMKEAGREQLGRAAQAGKEQLDHAVEAGKEQLDRASQAGKEQMDRASQAGKEQMDRASSTAASRSTGNGNDFREGAPRTTTTSSTERDQANRPH